MCFFYISFLDDVGILEECVTLENHDAPTRWSSRMTIASLNISEFDLDPIIVFHGDMKGNSCEMYAEGTNYQVCYIQDISRTPNIFSSQSN